MPHTLAAAPRRGRACTRAARNHPVAQSSRHAGGFCPGAAGPGSASPCSRREGVSVPGSSSTGKYRAQRLCCCCLAPLHPCPHPGPAVAAGDWAPAGQVLLPPISRVPRAQSCCTSPPNTPGPQEAFGPQEQSPLLRISSEPSPPPARGRAAAGSDAATPTFCGFPRWFWALQERRQ